MSRDAKNVVIIGAGPAGLTAAYELCKAGIPSVVLEKDHIVGGISRTVNYKGYHFDIGGHRFFTKVKAVDEMWREVLKEEEFLHRGRLSRIYYDKRFFHYPLRPSNALFGLGIWNSFMILCSYLQAQARPQYPEKTFEQWVCNRFGKRLYRIFFKTYTEKVWGIPCNEITAEWAAQRIKGLSLLTAVKSALTSASTNKGDIIKTLIDSFDYPAKGPGMMWEAVAEIIQKRSSTVRMNTGVNKIFWAHGKVTGVEVQQGSETERIRGTHFVSTMPIRELIAKLDPAPPEGVLAASRRLSYRDFITVALIIDKAELFPDNWIYVHDPDVRVGRIQNFKNWSPDMVPDQTKTCLGLEYFCFEGDSLWTMADADIVKLASREIAILGLAREQDILDGTVVRMPKAYPVYDSTYMEALRVVREFLLPLSNLHLVGRNGMHKYNNQDHSMLTAMLAVENILGAKHDIWQVNVDQDYHEEVRKEEPGDQLALLRSTQPRVPQRKEKS